VKFVEIPKFEDRTEWLKWRAKGLGASDLAIIMGVSRFKTREELLHEKALETIQEQNSYIAERGNRIEFQVRMYLERFYNESFQPCNTECAYFPFLRASLDGFSDDRTKITEIKLLSVQPPGKYKETEGYKKWKALKDERKVPKEYWPQVQGQLAVTGAKECLFVGYCEEEGNQVVTEDKLAMTIVYPDQEYQKELLKKAFEFWLDVVYLRDKLQYRGELD